MFVLTPQCVIMDVLKDLRNIMANVDFCPKLEYLILSAIVLGYPQITDMEELDSPIKFFLCVIYLLGIFHKYQCTVQRARLPLLFNILTHAD